MKKILLAVLMGVELMGQAAVFYPGGSGGGVATATNAIGNNSGSGTNTSLYGNTTVSNLIFTGSTSNLWNIITPEMYGATGNASTDDTVAIQAAWSRHEQLISQGVDAELVLTPKSNYIITANIISTNAFNVRGNSVPWTSSRASLSANSTFRCVGTAGLVMTNNSVFGMRIKNVSFVGSNYLATGKATLGGIGITMLSTNANSQYLDMQGVSVVGFDNSILLTNMNELKIDGLLVYNCTNGLKVGQVGSQSMQGCSIRHYEANVYTGTSLAIQGGDYSMENLDIGAANTVTSDVVTLLNCGPVSFKNCNIEGTGVDTAHYTLRADNTIVMFDGGELRAAGGTQIPVVMTNNGYIHFTHNTQVSADAGGVVVRSYNTDHDSSTFYGIENGSSYYYLTNVLSGKKTQLLSIPYVSLIPFKSILFNQSGFDNLEIGGSDQQGSSPTMFSFGGTMFFTATPSNDKFDWRDHNNNQLMTLQAGVGLTINSNLITKGKINVNGTDGISNVVYTLKSSGLATLIGLGVTVQTNFVTNGVMVIQQ